jgi:heme-degrading monooxygenase HmoA
MFARVSVYELPEDRADDAAERFREALEEISRLDGFEEGYFLVDPESGRATATVMWSSRAAMAASRVTGSRLRTEAARAVDGVVVSAQEYEVAVHTRGVRDAVASS